MKLLYLLPLLFLLPLVSAEETNEISTFQQFKDVDISFACVNAGSFCSASATCNITVNYPNTSIAVNNLQLTNQISRHNFTMTGNLVDQTGLYSVDRICIDGNSTAVSEAKFFVTPSGYLPSIVQLGVYGLGFFVMMGILIGSLVGVVRIPWKNVRDEEDKIISINEKKHLKIVFVFMSWLSLLFLFWLAGEISAGLLFTDNLSPFFGVMYTVFLVFTFPVAVFLLTAALFNYTKDKKFQRLIDRGVFLKG